MHVNAEIIIKKYINSYKKLSLEGRIKAREELLNISSQDFESPQLTQGQLSSLEGLDCSGFQQHD